MSSEYYPSWSRWLDLVIGVAILVVSLWIVIDSTLTQRTIILTIAIALLIVGFVRIIKSIFMKRIDTRSRITKGTVGVAAVLISVGVVLFPGLAITFLVTMMTFAIMLMGMSRVIVGYLERELATWARALYMIGGAIAFGFGFLAALFPGLGFYTLILLISAAMITVGVIRIASGITGELR
ncbi:MAG: DUF308 domain-containing protein [Promethearchaeota archaeon]